MSKFHINPSTGNPSRCFALKKCRFGGDDEHYSSKELAAFAYEASHFDETLTVLKKNSDEIQKRPEDFAVNLHEPRGEELTEAKIAEADRKFQNLKQSSSKVMEDFKTPVSVSNDAGSTSLRFDQGRGVVTITGEYETQIAGDYPIGDLTQDSDTVVELLQKDPALQYINGDCATLAWDLYDAYPEHVKSVSEIWVKGDVGSMHVIAELKDGSFVDGLGHWSPSGIINAWKDLMGKDVEILIGDPDKNHKQRIPMFESTKILGKYLETLQQNQLNPTSQYSSNGSSQMPKGQKSNSIS